MKKVNYIKDIGMSLWEYCQTKNILREDFNKLLRGFVIDNDIVFYKDNFIYDDDLIEEALKYIVDIKNESNKNELKIYYGLKIKPELERWSYDYFYGIINEKNEIVREV